VGEEEEELHDGRTAGPRPWRTLHCNRGKKNHSPPGKEKRRRGEIACPGRRGGKSGAGGGAR